MTKIAESGVGRAPDSLRRRLIVAAAALPAACAAPVPQLAPPAVPPPLPQVRVGQRWRYATIDLYRGTPVGELQAEVVRAGGGGRAPLVVALKDQRGGALGDEQWAHPWSIVVDPSYDTPQIFESPMPYLPDTLVPGARRSDATRYQVPNSSARFHWRQQLRATGWERVVVPAGSFDALRVERYINFEHWDIWRLMPWRIDVVWYAPEAGRWVQRDWTGQYRWPGRRPVEVEENRVRWQLLAWHGA